MIWKQNWGDNCIEKIEYSQIVRKKLNQLKTDLVQDFGAEVSRKSVKKITDAVRGLEKFEKKGIAVSAMYNIECDYRYLYVSHNYVFYRIESEKIIIVEMFDEREDFMYKLFRISTRTLESIDYWGDED